MPYRYIDPDVFLERGGVTVWHVYSQGTEYPHPRDYWFTTNEATADDCYGHGQNGHFDARMFAARWSETPTIQQWVDFWKPRFKFEHEAIEALIESAIDSGRLTQGGLRSSNSALDDESNPAGITA